MTTIVEPKKHVTDLWSKPEPKSGETYRLMRYVMRIDQAGKVLLHNVVTGQLVLLDESEADLLEQLPMQHSTAMDDLIGGHYLVTDQFDEHRQVLKLREVLTKLDGVQRDSRITAYTILTTTACNARCYYCFEQGTEVVTMSEQTAREIIEYIALNCGKDKKVFILWFGGEPTVASNRIDQICSGLHEKGIYFESDMISNGFLFDEEMVCRAKELWNLRHVQISVDGIEENYNKIKDYVSCRENPYQRVMRNIGMLLDNGIRVGLRMNFDVGNYKDFERLLQEASERFGSCELLNVHAYPVIGEYADKDGIVRHGSYEWMEEQYVELNEKARETGLYRNRRGLPHLIYCGCGAANKSTVTVTPKGEFVRCSEQFDESQVYGDVRNGILKNEILNSWMRVADPERCKECVYFPSCAKLENCNARDNCLFQDRNQLYKLAVINRYNGWVSNNNDEKRGGNDSEIC